MISDEIEQRIREAIKSYDRSFELGDATSFEELISMGELVDRLSIVNFKLYTLKNEVMRREGDDTFRAWASKEDVHLCQERSLLKNCINDKLITTIKKSSQNVETHNPETKLYR